MGTARRTLVVIGLLALVLAGAAVVFLHYVPFDLPSYATWAGIGVGLVGIVSLLRPLRWLGVATRVRGLLVLLGGMAVSFVAVLWPASITTAGTTKRLDAFLPSYQFSEYHEAIAHAPIARVAEAARQVGLGDMKAAALLLRVRHLAGGETPPLAIRPEPILDMMARPGSGFLPLDTRDSREIVYGMAGRPWANQPPPAVLTPEQFLEFAEPGQIRVAFDIRLVEERPGVVRVSTETRTLGTDAEATRLFARYWRVIYPGSAIIRRVWLDAIVARAERPQP